MAVTCLVVFTVLALVLWHVRGPVSLDDRLGYTKPSYAVTWKRIMYLGSPWLVFTALLVMATLAFALEDSVALAVCVLGPLLAAICEMGAKPTVSRIIGHELSYPSGHVTLATSLAAVVVFVAYRRGGAPVAGVAAAPVGALVVLVSIAVVQTGAHYPTDAVGGVALAVGVVCATAAVLLNLWPRLDGRASWRSLAGVAKVRASGIDPEPDPANERRGTYEDS